MSDPHPPDPVTSPKARCPVCQRPRTFHPECFSIALDWLAYGYADAPVGYNTLVCQLGRTCYLCGAAPAEEIEHVEARSRGGPDTWVNVGAACAPCNRRKGPRLTPLSTEQRERLTEQQERYRAARARITPDLVAAELLRRARLDTHLEDDDPADWFAEAVEDQLDTYTGAAFTVEAQGDGVKVTVGDATLLCRIEPDPPT